MIRSQDFIVELIERQPDGLRLSAIRLALKIERGLDVADRTLQRHLKHLVESGIIRREGVRAGTQYLPARAHRKGDTPDTVPLGPNAQRVLQYVQQPTGARTLVGYNESMLQDYTPGVTWYLTAAQRRHLHDVGHVIDSADPAGTFIRQVYERLLIDLAWSSSRLEGNTYSRLDTERLLQAGELATGKDAKETQMILNHKQAIEMLVDNADSISFNRRTICSLHAALAENLLADPRHEGQVRRLPVGITATVFTPLSIPQRLDELFDVLLQKAEAIPDAFEQALFIMVHIPYLQPFIDVNKRTSRLAANIPFIRQNLCPLSFVDVPDALYVKATLGVYELRDTALLADLFVWAYERSASRYRIVRDSVPQPDPIRLRYRNALSLAVQDMVRALTHRVDDYLTDRTLQELGVAPADHEAFRQRLRSALDVLHDGVIGRYGIRPGEFERWQSASAKSR
jgi:DNA-binding Lrp family transcriptional regulator